MIISCTTLPSSQHNLTLTTTIHTVITIRAFVSRIRLFTHILRLICKFSNTTYTTNINNILSSFNHFKMDITIYVL